MVKAGRSLGKFLRKTILSPEWMNIQRTVKNLPAQLMRETGIDEEDFKIDLENPNPYSTTSPAKPAASPAKKTPTIAEDWVTPPKPAPSPYNETEGPTSPDPSPPTKKSSEDTESN